MRKIIALVLCVCALAVVFGCKKKQDAPAEKAEFIVGLDDSFPPMGFRDDNNTIVGFDIDLARETASRMGKTLVLQPIDWGSKELELESGNIDCIWNGLSVDPERQAAMLLSKPYLANQMIIVVAEDSPIISKADLAGKRVGVQSGSTAVKSLEKDPISAQVEQIPYENNVLALTDLKVGRVDAVVMDEVVARYQMSKDKGSYKILNETLDKEVYAVGFKKGNDALAGEVNKILADMASDGTSAAVSEKWFGEDIVLK